MSLPGDLLDQARDLARKEPRKPRQASLRRAVSVAYYSFFHLLVAEASRAIAGGSSLCRCLTARAFNHSEMKEASKAFAGGTFPSHVEFALGSQGMAPELRLVAEVFHELQQARHEADYDTSRRFTRWEARALVAQAEQATQSWRRIRSTEGAKIYLHALFAWRKWRR